jgi:hypothetical protein
LLRAAELFAQAREPARRDVIVEYARLKLPEKALRARRWVALTEPQPAAQAAKDRRSPALEAAARDLAAADAALQAARAAAVDSKRGTR